MEESKKKMHKCLNHLHGHNSFDHGQFVNLWSKVSILTMVKMALTMQMTQALLSEENQGLKIFLHPCTHILMSARSNI